MNYNELDDMREVWRDVAGYKGHYKVSNRGRVMSVKYAKARILKQNTHPSKRFQVDLHLNHDKGKTFKVHHLVLNAFKGACPARFEASHLNGDGFDNHVDNLIWESHQNNVDRQIEHETRNIGSRNGQAKLTEKDVKMIKILLKERIYHDEIAQRFNVSKQSITNISIGRTWLHVK